MATITIPRHIEHRNGFDIQSEIRHNFDNTQHWLHFQVYQNGKFLYSESSHDDNESLKKIHLFTDSQNYRDEIDKKEKWALVLSRLNLMAVGVNKFC